jgi:uncharacterized protein
MEIRQQFVVEQPIEAVWAALSDIRLVASCMPGAEIVSVSDDQTEIEGRLRTKVGPLSAAFNGRGRVIRDNANHTGTVEGSGADKGSGSRVQVKLGYSLEPSGDRTSTTTSIVAGVVLSGPLAQFGKGALISEIAAQMTQEFTKNLGQRFVGTAAGSSTSGGEGVVPTQPVRASELRPMRLLLAVLKARFARFFRLSAG